jgi:hypothetical protein
VNLDLEDRSFPRESEDFGVERAATMQRSYDDISKSFWKRMDFHTVLEDVLVRVFLRNACGTLYVGRGRLECCCEVGDPERLQQSKR